MASKYNKGYNPCDAAGDELIPAKIWALHCRNSWFGRVVARLQTLDRRPRLERFKEGRTAWEISWRIVCLVTERNPFAGIALQWLVPDPIFRVERDGPEGDEEGEGTTPNPKDKSWRWGSSSQLNLSGRLNRRGPEIIRRGRNDKRFRSPFQEWKGWPGRRLNFTLDTPWPEAPVGFRRQFIDLWTNPESFEATPFFQGWSPLELAARAQARIRKANELLLRKPEPPIPTQEGGAIRQVPQVHLELTETEKARMFIFDEIARNYRVVAIPRRLLTRQEAKAALQLLMKQITKELPDAHHLLGTPGQWNDFLGVEAVKKANAIDADKPALLHYLRTHYGSQNRTLDEIRHTNETDVTRRVAYIAGLRDRIFPTFNLAELLTPMDHRRAKKPR